jgi:hypothetical protein
MLASGVQLKIAQERPGHSSVSVTIDLCSHLLANMQAEAVNRVDATLREALNRRNSEIQLVAKGQQTASWPFSSGRKPDIWQGFRSVAQWLEHRSPNSFSAVTTHPRLYLNLLIRWVFPSSLAFCIRFFPCSSLGVR